MDLVPKGAHPRGKTPEQLDVADVLDAGYTPQGLAIDELRRVRRVRRV